MSKDVKVISKAKTLHMGLLLGFLSLSLLDAQDGCISYRPPVCLLSRGKGFALPLAVSDLPLHP
jgi:hypothetical protein